jgi:hypothetical protein
MTNIANRHGGARPGAGRKKGSKNRRVQSLLEKYPMRPLELMLKVLNDENGPLARRLKVAKAAARYLHPRLAPGQVEEERPEPKYDLRKLSDEELMQYERILTKMQVRGDKLN